MTNATPVYGWQYANLSTDPLTYPVVSGETFLRAIESTVQGVDVRVAALEASYADLLSYAVPLSAMKTSTTSRNSAVVAYTADPHLVLTIPAGRSYDFEYALALTSDANSAGDFLCQLSWTGTATVNHVAVSGLINTIASGSAADLEAAAGTNDSTSPTVPFIVGASTSPSEGIIRGRITTTTLTTLTLDWFQWLSNINNTNLLIGSSAYARRRA